MRDLRTDPPKAHELLLSRVPDSTPPGILCGCVEAGKREWLKFWGWGSRNLSPIRSTREC